MATMHTPPIDLYDATRLRSSEERQARRSRGRVRLPATTTATVDEPAVTAGEHRLYAGARLVADFG